MSAGWPKYKVFGDHRLWHGRHGQCKPKHRCASMLNERIEFDGLESMGLALKALAWLECNAYDWR